MSNNTNQLLIRAKDVTLIITVCTLLGMIFTFYKKPYAWDRTVERMDKVEPMLAAHETRLAVIDARSADILDQLRSINRKLDRR